MARWSLAAWALILASFLGALVTALVGSDGMLAFSGFCFLLTSWIAVGIAQTVGEMKAAEAKP